MVSSVDYSERILKVIRKYDKISTSKIGHILNINYYDVENCLNLLIESNKIKKIKNGKWLYWKAI